MMDDVQSLENPFEVQTFSIVYRHDSWPYSHSSWALHSGFSDEQAMKSKPSAINAVYRFGAGGCPQCTIAIDLTTLEEDHLAEPNILFPVLPLKRNVAWQSFT
ncbi:hypothetical protein VTL71DRAFT_7508 [Oculimacula yallundae]|uniref:Uncharacterized protein n=1 Tax=Oculimacula yallundae TaxID=86028 RepID=A0ABR4BUB5_9HELO